MIGLILRRLLVVNQQQPKLRPLFIESSFSSNSNKWNFTQILIKSLSTTTSTTTATKSANEK
jgi:hypothetical protein